jgi:phosphoglycolate phosphatase-like HAD superfamily hydrolase
LKLIFWDIDGTLIKTEKAGLYAFEQATAEIWNKPIDFAEIKTSGMTDFYIAGQIIEVVTGRAATVQEAQILSQRYEELLASHLAIRKGLVLPAVRDILELLHGHSGYKSLLLTGNSRIGAQLKLQKFGLDHYFDFDSSAFCNGSSTRDEVAICALRAAEALNSHEQLDMFVIGDTPNDIRCGKAIGAHTIGVATGTYTLEQLEACSPWWAVQELPSAQEFVNRLEGVAL